MKVIETLDAIPKLKQAFITIGNFDGLHIGHQKIMRTLLEKASGQPTLVFTFTESPLSILKPELFKGYLFPQSYKAYFIGKMGIDYLVSMDFNAVRSLSADEFLDKILSKIDIPHFFVGPDFKFGRSNSGSIETLEAQKQLGKIGLTVLEKAAYNTEIVSSSAIRSFIMTGQVEFASSMLSRPYFIESTQIRGDRIGSKIGFPTLNLKINHQVLPGEGIYFTYYLHQGKYLPAMSYIGKRPTINGQEIRNETHIIDFTGEESSIENKDKHILLYIKKIREEKKFNNLDELQKKLYNDRQVVLAFHQSYTLPESIYFDF